MMVSRNAAGLPVLLLALLVIPCLGQGCGAPRPAPGDNPPPVDDNTPPPGDPPPPPAGLAPQQARVAFASQCALNVITCTTSWPEPVARVEAGPYQWVTETPTGYLVQGWDGDGSEVVQFIGSDSIPGVGAQQIFYSWSYGATDDDPCTLHPGEEFSTDADPKQALQAGFHYIRLSVRNDIVRGRVQAPECGVIGEDIESYDFVELEIEVRD